MFLILNLILVVVWLNTLEEMVKPGLSQYLLDFISSLDLDRLDQVFWIELTKFPYFLIFNAVFGVREFFYLLKYFSLFFNVVKHFTDYSTICVFYSCKEFTLYLSDQQICMLYIQRLCPILMFTHLAFELGLVAL